MLIPTFSSQWLHTNHEPLFIKLHGTQLASSMIPKQVVGLPGCSLWPAATAWVQSSQMHVSHSLFVLARPCFFCRPTKACALPGPKSMLETGPKALKPAQQAIYEYEYTYMYLNVYVYIHICTHIYIYMCVYTCIHVDIVWV